MAVIIKKLSDRQKLFCTYVAEGDNPSLAAIQAGYSEKGNRSRACRLMKKDEIRAEIKRLQDEIASPRIASVLERKQQLSKIIRANMREYFEVVNEQLQWIANREKPPDGLFEIKTKIRTDKSGNVISKMMSVKLGNIFKAIHMLNKMDGVYKRGFKTQGADPQKRELIVNVISPEEFPGGH